MSNFIHFKQCIFKHLGHQQYTSYVKISIIKLSFVILLKLSRKIYLWNMFCLLIVLIFILLLIQILPALPQNTQTCPLIFSLAAFDIVPTSSNKKFIDLHIFLIISLQKQLFETLFLMFKYLGIQNVGLHLYFPQPLKCYEWAWVKISLHFASLATAHLSPTDVQYCIIIIFSQTFS